MIGRESELRQVEAFLDGAVPGVRVLVIDGAAGIGKTSLWEAAIEAARARGQHVVTTRPTEAEARLPFAGLNDLFGPVVDARPPGLPAPQQLALDIALMRASPGGEPMQPLALSLAVLELMRIASATGPLVVGIDDARWLDDSTAGVLRFALRRLEAEPVAVIVTERTPAADATQAVFADLPPDRVTRLTVEGLRAEAIDRLLDDTLQLRLAPTMLRRVVRLSGGNPFFAIEIGRALVARGADAMDERLPLPESLTALLRDRIASLAPEAREVAAHVAALSQPNVEHLESALGPEVTRTGLGEAREADMLAVVDGAVRFTHPLLATEVYAGLPDEQRRDVHRRLASVVSEPEELARHLALGATGPDGDVAETLDAAAIHALGRGAPDAAAQLSVLAADLTPLQDGARARRMASAGRYWLMSGDVGRARELLERALGEPAAVSGVARAELLYRLAGVRQLMDDFAAAEALGREGLRHAGDDAHLAIQLKLLLAGVSYITGRDWTSGSRHAAEAMELAEQLDEPAVLAATIGRCLTWCYVTGRGYRRDLAERAAGLEAWTAQFRTLDLPEYDIAGIELFEGETTAAYDRLHRLLERAERDGDYSSLPFLLANLAIGDFLEGRTDAAREAIERAMRLAQVTELRVAQVHTLANDARLASRLGDADRALAAGAAAFDLMDATGWRMGEWAMRADLALLELSRGDPSAALALVAHALDPTGPDEPPRRRWAEFVAIDALLALGRHADARVALDEFERYARSHGSPRLVAEAHRGRARLLAADGRVDEADAAIAEAEAIHRRMEDRWELARTLLAAGEVHRRARRRARARAALREALELFAFLGSGLWARQAREDLARIDAAREAGRLTPTQRRVAELVAGGLRNRQVADRLSMSVHTVEAHLSAIYQALGIRSRSEVASALASDARDPRDSTEKTRDSRSS
ncbi:MAG TPA: AAA family ATPase [Patescibacteria group bacterium]|nr:AAA family ATPase [Patescibacteria group bacterium]